MIAALPDGDRELRGFIAQAFCRIGEPALGALRDQLGSADEALRSCSELILWQMGEAGIDAMVESYAIEKGPQEKGKSEKPDKSRDS
jgi:hypothetical protein